MSATSEKKISIKCDGKDCPISYWWVAEETDDPVQMKKNLLAMPDPVFRFIIVLDYMGLRGNEKHFCSKFCLLNYMKTYNPPKSPREMEEESQKKQQEIDDLEKLAVTKPDPTKKHIDCPCWKTGAFKRVEGCKEHPWDL